MKSPLVFAVLAAVGLSCKPKVEVPPIPDVPMISGKITPGEVQLNLDLDAVKLKVDLGQLPQIPQMPKFPPAFQFEPQAKAEVAFQAKGSTKEAVAEYEERTRQLLLAAEKGRLSLIVDLVKKGADVNDKDEEGQTALHKAMEKGHRSVIMALILFGADMNEKDNKGMTPFMVACEGGDLSLLKVLSSSPQLRDDLKLLAAKIDGIKIDANVLESRVMSQCGRVMEQFDKQGRNGAIILVENGHVECVKEYGLVDVAYAIRKDKKGRNCYHIAASSGNADLLAGLLDKYQLTLETLDITDNTGKTPLELAQAGKNPQLAKLIQRRRAFLAIKADNLALFKELLTHFPADLDQPNLIAYACSDARAAILKLLLEANKGLSADEKMILLGASGKTPSSLQYAVAAGRTEIVRLLIDEEWWKEKEALVRYLDWVAGENSGASYLTPVYKSEAMLKEKPESAAVVKAVADKLIPKKEKK